MSEPVDQRMPTIYLTHGGGPCFFMESDPPDAWDGLRAGLESVRGLLPAPPKAIFCITAHWEESPVSVEVGERPELVFDYYGFPPHTYELTYPAPGEPTVAARVVDLLNGAGIAATAATRGWDHGVFIPLMVSFPDADVPVVAVSLQAGLDPDAHLAMGAALAPLRDEGILLIGSGSSYHNVRVGGPAGAPAAQAFDDWLQDTLSTGGVRRAQGLRAWSRAPGALVAHPREEHLLPLHVVAGAAADEPGRAFFDESVRGTKRSCWIFGAGA